MAHNSVLSTVRTLFSERIFRKTISPFNRRHKLFGDLFSGRYKLLLVDGSGTGYSKAFAITSI
jgi:hypothetical protein